MVVNVQSRGTFVGTWDKKESLLIMYVPLCEILYCVEVRGPFKHFSHLVGISVDGRIILKSILED
jgi:hypothetical protein